MAFVEGSYDGALNGTTPVTIVASPASGVRRIVKTINIVNRDTASVGLNLIYVNGANSRYLVAPGFTLASGDTFIYDNVQVLDTTSKSITASLTGAPATTNPDFTAAWADAS